MMEEVGEASAANLEGEGAMRVLEELTQATAVGLAWMAMLIRQASGEQSESDAQETMLRNLKRRSQQQREPKKQNHC